MTYGEYCEQAHVVYTLTVNVNDEETAMIQALSEDGLIEQWRKLDHAIEKKLEEQFEELSESEV